MRYSDETDYRNIKGLYYMADIPAQDFASDKYAISMTKKTGKDIYKYIKTLYYDLKHYVVKKEVQNGKEIISFLDGTSVLRVFQRMWQW